MEGAYYKTKESVNEYIKLAKGVDGKDLIEKTGRSSTFQFHCS